MKSFAIAVASLLMCHAMLPGQDAISPPAIAPEWVVVKIDEPGFVSMVFPVADETGIETYTVNIPFAEVGPDGEVVMKMRTETRVRKRDPKLPRRPTNVRWPAKDLKFLNMAGEQLEFTDLTDALSKPTPVMAITEPKIGRFFSAILKPETIAVVIPAREARR